MRIFPIDKDSHIQTLGGRQGPDLQTHIHSTSNTQTKHTRIRIQDSFLSVSHFPLPSSFTPPNSSFFLFSSFSLFLSSNYPCTSHCRPVVVFRIQRGSILIIIIKKQLENVFPGSRISPKSVGTRTLRRVSQHRTTLPPSRTIPYHHPLTLKNSTFFSFFFKL